MEINVGLKLIVLLVALSSFTAVTVDSNPDVLSSPETAGEEVAARFTSKPEIFGRSWTGAFMLSQKPSGKLVIFSGRKEPLVIPVLSLFQQRTGIEITLKTGSATELAQQVLQELPDPSADVFIANDSGTLEFLRLKGALQPYLSEAVEKIPERFRAKDGSWLGVSGRSRAIIYNTKLIKPEELPTTVFDLIDPKWKGKIAATNAGNESFVSWISALRLTLGDELVKTFLEKLKENKIALLGSSHTDVRKAVGRGEFTIGLINHYYYHLQLREPDEGVRNVGILYHDQGPFHLGTLINAAGAAIIKNAKNLAEAQQFMDFLASPEAQKLFAELNFEYPLLPGTPTHPEVIAVIQQATGCDQPAPLDCLKQMPIPLDRLGIELERTQDLLEEAGWL